MFAVLNQCLQREEVGVHISHLRQSFEPYIYIYVTYKDTNHLE